ncbi:MAG: hypothetical protein AB1831_07365 [Pseudomonadota bacterium]
MTRPAIPYLLCLALAAALAATPSTAAETARRKAPAQATPEVAAKGEQREAPARKSLRPRPAYQLPDFSVAPRRHTTQARQETAARQGEDLPYGAGYEARQHVLSEDIMFAPVSGGRHMGGSLGGLGGDAGEAGGAGDAGGGGGGRGR